MSSIDDPGYHTANEHDGEDLGHISRRLQSSAFINDLQHGLSLSNALTRLQTMKALMEQVVSEAIETNVDSDDEYHDCAAGTDVEEPKGVTLVATPKMIPTYNDVVIPQDKFPEGPDTEALTTISTSEKNDHGALRKRIKQINELDLEPRRKALMIQKLMMGGYNASDREETPDTEDDYSGVMAALTDEDSKPLYQKPGVLGCPHYQRACKLRCDICRQWVPCRLCHDEAHQDKSHMFDKDKAQWIMCMRCQNVQRPSRTCENCLEEFAAYCCEICKLYDNDEAKDIYHCDKCGICRLGLGLGIDFFHCDGCHACLSIELQDNHKCIERATMSNCPICGDYMFTSVKPVVYMSPCGHAIHQHCFDEYTRHSYKCPHCQVTVLNMDAQFRVLDKEIEEQPLPEPYCNWMCIVSCNDCKGRSKCNYHIMGLKCGHCLSYNTTQVKLIKPENDDSTGDNVDLNALAEFSHSMNHSVSENLLRDHFQTEDVSPLINMDNSMMSNIDQYMNEYFKDKHGDKNKESHHVNDFINTKNLFRKGTTHQEPESQSMNRATSLTEKFKQLIGDSLPVQRSLSEVFQSWRQDPTEDELPSKPRK